MRLSYEEIPKEGKGASWGRGFWGIKKY